MRIIFKFLVLVIAVAVILMVMNFIYLYAQDKEANSIVYKLVLMLLNKYYSL
jgi:hypothetical protein